MSNMIEFVQIKDFQSHKDNTFRFNPLFNIIIGPSGNGKSSILRAIKYTAFNNPGVSEVRWPDAKTYQISIGVNGHVVKRVKGSGKNSYKIDDLPELEDVNRDVPKTVQDILDIKKVSLDTSVDLLVQFSDQLDGPFMLGEKDTTKMKFLNVLSGTNAVDLAAKQANSVLKDVKKIEKQKETSIKELEEQEKQLMQQLADTKRINNYLAQKAKLLKELVDMRQPVYDLKRKSDYVHNEYKKLQAFDNYLNKIDIEKILKDIEKYEKLQETQSQYVYLKAKSKALNEKIVLLDSVCLDGLDTKIEKLMELRKISADRDVLKSRYLALKRSISGFSEQYDTCVAEYVEYLNKAKICPVCGNSITQECLDKIAKTL